MVSHLDHIRQSKVDNVRLVDHGLRGKPVVGTLHLTTSHIIFVDPKGARETWILYGHIDSTERLPLTAAGSPIKIKTKHFRSITFVISREKDCADVFSTIVQFASPTSIADLYAFYFKPIDAVLTQQAGWLLYDPASEFSRMEVPSELWVLSKLNMNYTLCDTYPSILYVPASASKDMINGSAAFRSKNRLPALSYYHKHTTSAIARCAQPLAGFNTRCFEDEQMLQAIIASNPKSRDMYIVDTRPKINAMANRAAGKGYENVENYDNVRFHFIGIENIHVMRQSLQKMIDIFDSKHLTMGDFLKGLDESGWLKHIKSVMETSAFIARVVHQENCSVLVHCSDGWDRTAQTCSLASLLLDPYYRTIHGFQILVEKEWLSFGHKFVDRCGFVAGDGKEVSPIFLQFLESVWQLMNQFPGAFQFNERYLLEIYDHVYSCQFGTFLGNSERERAELRLPEKTYSLWGYIWQKIPDYINPFYDDAGYGVLHPGTALQQLAFWKSLYCRFNQDIHARESIADHVCALNDHNDSLRDHIRYLESVNSALKGELRQAVTPHGISQLSSSPTLLANATGQDYCVEPRSCMDSSVESFDEKLAALDLSKKENVGDSLVQSPLPRSFSVPDLSRDVSKFAIDWSSVRNVVQCSCGSPIDQISRKYNCWNCGQVFCGKCLDRQSVIPGHYSENKVPVCKPCFKILRRS